MKLAMNLSKLIYSLLLSLTVSQSFAQQKLIDKVVATVGDRMILYSDIQQQKLQMIQNRIPVNNETDCIILDELVFQKLLLHQADVDSVEVTEEQIEAELNNRLTYFRRMLEQYGRTLEEEYGMSEARIKEDFRPQVKERVLVDMMEDRVAGSGAVTPREIREFFETIPKDSLPRMNMQISYSHITMNPEITAEAEENEIKKLVTARDGVLNGTNTFAYYATLYSKDPGSAMNGGDFGCVSKGMFVPEFDQMAMSMEPGQISPPFKSMYGWHILKLNERRGDTYCGAHILVTPRIDQGQLVKARNQLDSIRKLILDGKITFEEAAKTYSADENSSNNGGKLYNFQNGTFKFDVSDLDRDVALTTDQLNPGEISPVVSFTNDIGQQAFRIIKLNLIFAPHVANLDDDYPLFQRAAQEDKKQKTQNEWYLDKATRTHLWITDDYKTCKFTFRETISAN